LKGIRNGSWERSGVREWDSRRPAVRNGSCQDFDCWTWTVDCLTRDTGNGTHTDTIHPAAPLFWRSCLAWSFLAFDVYTGTSKYVFLTAKCHIPTDDDDDMWKEHGNGGPAFSYPLCLSSEWDSSGSWDSQAGCQLDKLIGCN